MALKNTDEDKVIKFLKEQIKKSKHFSDEKFKSEFMGWKELTNRILENKFGKESSHSYNFTSACEGVEIHVVVHEDELNEMRKERLEDAREILKGIIEEIQKFKIPELDKSQSSNSSQTFNIQQNQSMNFTIEALKNNLTVSEFEELNTILKGADKKKKATKVTEFFTKICESTLVKILTNLIV